MSNRSRPNRRASKARSVYSSRSALLVGTVLVVACSASSSDPAGVVRGAREGLETPSHPEDRDCDEDLVPVTVQAVSPGDVGVDPIAGFQDSIATTQFALGAGPVAVETVTGPYAQTRYVGAGGTFLAWENGFALAAQHRDSVARAAAPLFTIGTLHNDRVLSYFGGRGLPADQTGAVRLTTHLYRAGIADGHELERRLLGYTSTITRVVTGIAVAESRASARFNVNDEVVYEQVWWPALPASVRSDIATFQDLLARDGAAYRARLPVELQTQTGTLVVHHAEPVAAAWFVVVTLDFQTSDRNRSFDPTATEVAYAKLAVPTVPLQTALVNDPKRTEPIKSNCKSRSKRP